MRQAEKKLPARLISRARAGSESVEWGLLSGLLVVVAIVAVVALSPKVTDLWNDTNQEIPASAGEGGGGGGSSGGGSSGGGGGSSSENTGNGDGVGYGNDQGT